MSAVRHRPLCQQRKPSFALKPPLRSQISAGSSLPMADVVLDQLGAEPAHALAAGRKRAAAAAVATVRLTVEDSVFTENKGAALCVDDQQL